MCDVGISVHFSCLILAKGEAREKLETAMMGVTDKFMLLEECEKGFVRKALTEERRHFCDYVCCLRPVVVCFLLISAESLNASSATFLPWK